MTLKVIIEPGEAGWVIARVPALPGCWSQGKTRAEALTNVKEAAEGWLEVQQDKIERSEPPVETDLITL
jgi:predicted RNase H-like HicB family nuclease